MKTLTISDPQVVTVRPNCDFIPQVGLLTGVSCSCKHRSYPSLATGPGQRVPLRFKVVLLHVRWSTALSVKEQQDAGNVEGGGTFKEVDLL